jgi:hypothetical protein
MATLPEPSPLAGMDIPQAISRSVPVMVSLSPSKLKSVLVTAAIEDVLLAKAEQLVTAFNRGAKGTSI